jgi:hypothetical protein
MCKWEGGGGKEGQWGLKVGQLTLGMALARAEVCSCVQRATIPSKRVIYTLKHSQSTTNTVIDHMCQVGLKSKYILSSEC